MYNDYIPYEIIRYERKLSCVDAPRCKMIILCKDEKAMLDLRHFIELWAKTNLIRATIDTAPNSRQSRINIETQLQSITDKIKDFVDEINRQPQTKTSNELVFQYGHDVIPLGQVGEVKIGPQSIEFTCNVGRKNGKSMASKDYLDALESVSKKDADITKEMKNMKIVALEFVPKKIIFSGPKCIVLWHDGTKTIVSCSENDRWDEYAAYCAALAKKLYGTTSAVHRMVDKKSNAKEYKESRFIQFEKIFAEAIRKAMKPFIKEDNDEPSEH